jgi:hypothetical protein
VTYERILIAKGENVAITQISPKLQNNYYFMQSIAQMFEIFNRNEPDGCVSLFCAARLLEHEKNPLCSDSLAHFTLGIAELRKKMHHTRA